AGGSGGSQAERRTAAPGPATRACDRLDRPKACAASARPAPDRPPCHNRRESPSAEPMTTKADLLRELRIDRTQAPPPRRRWLWITLAVLGGLLLLALVASALSGGSPAEVRVAPVAAGDAEAVSVLDASGYVVARRMATVSAKITGRVREVLIEEGMEVEECQVMATLDPVDADAQRSLAAAQLAAARTQVGSVQAQLTEAEANARRLESMVGQQLVSRAQYEQAVAQRDALRAQLASAERQVDVAADQLAI